MTPDRTPVLVGAGRLTQRIDEPGAGLDAIELIGSAVEIALADTGVSGLGSRAGPIFVPRGMWRCPDPGRLIADRIGAKQARTIVAEVGVLQHSVITAACEAIASGQADVAIVCGGEARYRHIVAARAGIINSEGDDEGTPPDATLRPDSEVVSSYEVERGIVLPSIQYAMIQNAYADAAGWTDDEHRNRLGALWSHYADVASRDRFAWDRSAPDTNTIVTATEDNRMIATPYTRLLCSQWNVDQAAALVFTSTSVAKEEGVPDDRFVFPVSDVESNAMIPMPQRRDIHRWPAFRLAAKRVLELADRSLDEIDALELYSCFPSAVLVQMNEMGLARNRALTLTGGMTFGGGPLNNFVLQATVAMATHIRSGLARSGLVTGVSGLLTKPGLTVWSDEPPTAGFRSDDVTAAALEHTPTRPMATTESGPATVIGSTVSYGREAPPVTLAVLELEDGSRTVASADGLGAAIGSRVDVTAPGRFSSS